MKRLFFLSLAFAATMAFAENDADMNEFGNEETIEMGILNNLIEKATLAKDDVEYGAKVTKYASTPKFGGYVIGKYAYNTDEALNDKQGFQQRMARVYVDGTLLNDFTYRMQLQVSNGNMHMKDFFVEWARYKEVRVKIGQFKRAFTFENPMNPWDVGSGDYSQLVKKLAGMGDYNGEANMGGRDQGLQVQGDLFPISEDKHRLVHYQLMVANGQGINVADQNSHKDLIGTIQFQPIKGLFIGAFGWTGNYTQSVTATGANKATNVTVDRKRYVLSAKYDWKDWTFRTEYGYSDGHKISDVRVIPDGNKGTMIQGDINGTGKADAFYATVGVPVQPWLKVYLKYDQYRDQATSDSQKTIYSIVPNIRLHKNLLFQLQYNYNDDKLLNKKYSELWLETYFRF